METILDSTLALFAALFTAPGLVLLVGWTVLAFYVGWRWSVRKAMNHPEWFAKRNAEAAALDASVRAAWQRMVDQLNR